VQSFHLETGNLVNSEISKTFNPVLDQEMVGATASKRIPAFLSNVQIIRGLAALAVVIYHTGTVFGVRTQFQAVPVFFVISGFIMSYIAGESSLEFAVNRVVRIVPLYWFATILFLVLSNQGFLNPVVSLAWWGHWIFSEPWRILVWLWQHRGLETVEAWKTLLCSLLFIPYPNVGGEFYPLLGVGWSINMEVFFYFLFALALAVNSKIAPFLVAVTLTVLIAVRTTYGFPFAALNFFTDIQGIFFVFGILIFYLWRWTSFDWLRRHKRALGIISVGGICAYVWLQLGLPDLFGERPAVPGYILPPALVLIALLLEKAGLILPWRPLIVLGNISYALYLAHPIFAEMVRASAEQWKPLSASSGYLAYPAVVVPSILVAMLLHYRLEVPTTRRLRRWCEDVRLSGAYRQAREPVNAGTDARL
jgi:exopolysaccharide production protein ExoZ